jgi:ankyrin repeat protein
VATVARRLRESDTAVDLESDAGSTALHAASSAGATQVIAYLLDHGASLHRPDRVQFF